ncbi:MAG: proline--tRNA ligase [Chloroflexi bacterium]|uniref:Proline--tRNA ligase n=1 Tax=Candidatus Chlorohelix allophototropha TaxID=3003348 RepID=A0A8T7M7N2_9CHLR|nr:proline--tRNA ligase [Chloroflexota bacterium]WJW68094.1 proline--tRNA ligase [Chloroflexota bacterium L227-S17]
MRQSRLFGLTLRETPGEADTASHQLLLRAGYIRQVGAGLYSYLPLAYRAIRKIEQIIREEINAIGGQELLMPVVNPAELWKETGRWYSIGGELARFKDIANRDMVLAMTHEEIVGDLIRREIRSYRQLPQLVYHIQTKFRDELRPRAGLIRTREFIMKDSYSLDTDEEGLDLQYKAHYKAYFRIFQRVGLPASSVSSDVGMMGGSQAHEFMYLTPIGEDTLIICRACGCRANRQVAAFQKPNPPHEEALPIEKVYTPGTKTIEALANYLQIPETKTGKAVFLVATLGEERRERLVMAIVRGDMEANETKISNAIKAVELRAARSEEITVAGAVPGYAGAQGVDAIIIADDLITRTPNLVVGANEENYHLKNVNYGRDFTADYVTDIVAAGGGETCPNCAASLEAVRGVEIGNIFKLGTRYSGAFGANFLDRDSQSKPIVMGSYGIGVGRLLACVCEEFRDEAGLKLPISVAPFEVHLVMLSSNKPEVGETAEKLYHDLQAAGLEILFDDRPDAAAGVKFADADLIGLPLRIVVSDRSLKAGGVEFKLRAAAERENVPLDTSVMKARLLIDNLYQDIKTAMQEVEFDTK